MIRALLQRRPRTTDHFPDSLAGPVLTLNGGGIECNAEQNNEPRYRHAAAFPLDPRHTRLPRARKRSRPAAARRRQYRPRPRPGHAAGARQSGAAVADPDRRLHRAQRPRRRPGQGAAGQWGWGNPVAAWFDPAKVNVVNRAVGGLSSRTYITSGHWERTLAVVKRGDIVVMQFGHNDASPSTTTSRARGTIRGVGDETEEIDNLLTHKHETVHSYGWYLRKFMADIRARRAPRPSSVRRSRASNGTMAGHAKRDRDTTPAGPRRWRRPNTSASST
jgi:hypothetical protein